MRSTYLLLFATFLAICGSLLTNGSRKHRCSQEARQKTEKNATLIIAFKELSVTILVLCLTSCVSCFHFIIIKEPGRLQTASK